MKKFVTLFTDSARELKSVRTITTMAMLAAVEGRTGMERRTAKIRETKNRSGACFPQKRRTDHPPGNE